MLAETSERRKLNACLRLPDLQTRSRAVKDKPFPPPFHESGGRVFERLAPRTWWSGLEKCLSSPRLFKWRGNRARHSPTLEFGPLVGFRFLSKRPRQEFLHFTSKLTLNISWLSVVLDYSRGWILGCWASEEFLNLRYLSLISAPNRTGC